MKTFQRCWRNLLLLTCLVAISAGLSGQTLLKAWDFTGLNGNENGVLATFNETGIGPTTGDVRRGAGILPFPAGGFDNVFISRDFDNMDLAGARSANEYVKISIRPSAGFGMKLTEISFLIGRQGNGPNTFALFTDAGGDGFTTQIGADAVVTSGGTTQSEKVVFDLTDPSVAALFDNCTTSSDAVSFRLYGWRPGIDDSQDFNRFWFGDGTASNGNDIEIQGFVEEIPVPTNPAVDPIEFCDGAATADRLLRLPAGEIDVANELAVWTVTGPVAGTYQPNCSAPLSYSDDNFFLSGTNRNSIRLEEDAPAGTYTFQYQILNCNTGCLSELSTASYTITKYELPTVDITADPNGDICIGTMDVAYDAGLVSTDGGTYSYAWCAYNSGDGSGTCFIGFNDNTAEMPTRSWATSTGPKSVGVTVTSDVPGCMATDLYSFEVLPLPTISCPTAVSPICENDDPLDLTSLSYGESPAGGSFVFSGAGVSGTDFDPAAAGVGTYTIMVEYTAPNTCVTTCSFDIEVLDLPAVALIPSRTDTEFCAGEDNGVTRAVAVNVTLDAGDRVVWRIASAPAGSAYAGGAVIDIATDPNTDAGGGDGEYIIVSGSKAFRLLKNPSVGGVPIYGVYTVYAFVRTADGCEGEEVGPMTLEVKENPELMVPNFPPSVCSDSPLSSVFSGFMASNGVGITSVDIVGVTVHADLSTVSGPTMGTGLAVDAIGGDTYNNLSSGGRNVTYSVILNGDNGCSSEVTDYTFRILAEPQMENDMISVCSEEATGYELSLAPGSWGNVDGPPNLVLFDIVSIDMDGLTPSAGAPAPGTCLPKTEIADDAYTNMTGETRTVIYTVRPVRGCSGGVAGCEGDEVQIMVKVSPEPMLNAFTTGTTDPVADPILVCEGDVDGSSVSLSFDLSANVTLEPGEQLRYRIRNLGLGSSVSDPNVMSSVADANGMTIIVSDSDPVTQTVEDILTIVDPAALVAPVDITYAIFVRLRRADGTFCDGNEIMVNARVVPQPRVDFIFGTTPTNYNGTICPGETTDVQLELDPAHPSLAEGTDFDFVLANISHSLDGSTFLPGYGPLMGGGYSPTAFGQVNVAVASSPGLTETLTHNEASSVFVRYNFRTVSLDPNTNCDGVFRGFVIEVLPSPAVTIQQFNGNPFGQTCSDEQAVFLASPPSAGDATYPSVMSYAWTFTSNSSVAVEEAGGGGGGTGQLATDGSPRRIGATWTNMTNAPITETVTLTVTYDNGCTAEVATHDIVVQPSPDVSINSFAGNPFTEVCSEEQAVFLASAPAAGDATYPSVMSYAWTFTSNSSVAVEEAGGGGGGTGQLATDGSPRRIGATWTNMTNAPITETVTLTVTYDNGCTAEVATHDIEVSPTPTLTVNYNANPAAGCGSGATVCSGSTTDGTFSGVYTELILLDIRHELEGNDASICGPGAQAGSGYGPVMNGGLNVGDDVSGGIAETLINPTEDLVRVAYLVEARYTANGITCAGERRFYDVVVRPQPRIECPASFSVVTSNNGTGDCTADASWTHPTDLNGACEVIELTLSIDGATPVAVTPGDPITETLAAGDHTIDYVITDGNGNTDDCSLTITVEDDERPTIACPGDETIPNDPGLCSAVYTVAQPTSADNCGVTEERYRYRLVDEIGDDLPGEGWSAWSMDATQTLAVGFWKFQWQAKDAAGNQRKCTFLVTVEDTENPVLDCSDLTITVPNDAGECQADVDLPVPVATDNCGVETLEYRYREVDEDNNALGPWSAWADAADNAVTLAVGNYRVRWRAIDEADNTTGCTRFVEVEDVEPPIIDCFNQTITFNGEASIDLLVEDLAEASDNCGIASLTLDINEVFCEQLSEDLTITATAVDVNDLVSTCTSKVFVRGLPCGWSQEPDGVGCEDGNDVEYDVPTETFTVNSTDCHNAPTTNTDEYAFAQYNLCGNGEIIAQVTNISGTSLGWAGVIMRESNDPQAKSVALMTNLSTNHRREARVTTGGTVTSQLMPSLGRHWLRIQRFGNQFRAYSSFNGVSWFLRFAQTIPMEECLEVGLVLNGYFGSGVLSASFENVSVQGTTFFEFQANAPTTEAAVNTKTFSVFPNPTAGQVTVNLADYLDTRATLEVVNTFGQVVFQRPLGPIENTQEDLDLSNLPAGVYIIRLHPEEGDMEMIQVVKQ